MGLDRQPDAVATRQWRRLGQQVPRSLQGLGPGRRPRRELSPKQPHQRRAPLLGHPGQSVEAGQELRTVL